jgi:hypothetical protein
MSRTPHTYTQKYRSLLLVLNEDGTINRKKHEKHPAVTATETHTREMRQRSHIDKAQSTTQLRDKHHDEKLK